MTEEAEGTNISSLFVAAPVWSLGEVAFMGCNFSYFKRRDEILKHIKYCASSEMFTYIVTPNVDNIVRIDIHSIVNMGEIYNMAHIRICDSRVLSLLGRIVGISLPVYPGADIIKDILSNGCYFSLKIGILGPSKEDFEVLSHLYPHLQLIYIKSSNPMPINSGDFQACVNLSLSLDWDLLIVCLGSPKQEAFVSALHKSGRSHGAAIAAGASVDFLTGRQTRAPAAMQRMGLEWLYRLATSPRRLGKRYLSGALAIAFLFWNKEMRRRYMPNIRRDSRTSRGRRSASGSG